MLLFIFTLIALDPEIEAEIDSRYNGDDEQMIEYLINERYATASQYEEIEKYLSTYQKPSSLFTSITQKYHELNLEEVVVSFKDHLKNAPALIRNFLDSNPKILNFFALLAKDEHALPALFGIVSNHKRLITFILLFLLTSFLAYLLKRLTSEFKFWTRFKLFFLRFLFILALRVYLFIFFFYESNLKPTWIIFKDTILK